MFPSKLVEAMFRAYCAERKMNPEDWPTIGEEKQRAWIAAANAAATCTNEDLDDHCVALRGVG